MKKIIALISFSIALVFPFGSANAQSLFSRDIGAPAIVDFVGGVAIPKVKIMYGADGSGTDISALNPLPVGGTLSVISGGKEPGEIVMVDYVGTPVSSAAYVEIIAATADDLTALEIFDSSGQSLYIAFGAIGLEVNKVFIIPGGNGLIPLSVPSGTRVSIKATGTSATVGKLLLNAYK